MTRKMLWGLAALLMLGGVMLMVQPSRAAEDKEKDKELTPDQVIEEITNAYKLAEFGKKHDAPEALIAAGTVLRSLQGTKMGKITEKPEGDDKSEVVESLSFEEQALLLFAKAKTIAKEHKIAGVEELVKAAQSRRYRAVIDGPKSISRTIGKKQAQVFHIFVEPNRAASFGFRADFPMEISIVRSDNDNVIASGTTAAGNVRHHFGGSGTGRVKVTIRIRNVGNQSGSYHLYAS